MGDVVYHVSFSLPFNYVSIVSSWCRVPALIMMAMVARRMFAGLCDSYIDDWCIVDFVEAESRSQDTCSSHCPVQTTVGSMSSTLLR